MFNEGQLHNNEEQPSEILAEDEVSLTEAKAVEFLDQQDGKISYLEIGRDPEKLSRIKKFLLTATVIGGSLVAQGCGANPEKPNVKPKAEAVMEKVGQKGQETFEKDKAFLDNMLMRIMGSKAKEGSKILQRDGFDIPAEVEIDAQRSKAGNIMARVNGKQYELDNQAMEKLTEIAGQYRRRLEHTQFKRAIEENALAAIRTGIVTYGKN
jgi:hypothetical protein